MTNLKYYRVDEILSRFDNETKKRAHQALMTALGVNRTTLWRIRTITVEEKGFLNTDQMITICNVLSNYTETPLHINDLVNKPVESK